MTLASARYNKLIVLIKFIYQVFASKRAAGSFLVLAQRVADKNTADTNLCTFHISTPRNKPTFWLKFINKTFGLKRSIRIIWGPSLGGYTCHSDFGGILLYLLTVLIKISISQIFI